MFGNLWNLIFTTNTADSSTVFSLFLSVVETATPLLFVWILSLFVWFGLELAVLNAHFFNTKHTYISELKRQFISLIALSTIFKNTKKTALLSEFYLKAL